jgi:RNA polymerase sigma factor (sigma-70 family)
VTIAARDRRFEKLYEEHASAVLRYCLRRARVPGVADDACSETFLVAWRRLDEIPPDSRPWLLAVARRVLANLSRGDGRREALRTRLSVAATEWTGAGEAADSGEAAVDDRLEAALAALSEADREALTLVYWDDLTTAEAAKAMNTTAAAVRVRLYRARRRLGLSLAERQSPTDFRVAKPSKELR